MCELLQHKVNSAQAHHLSELPKSYHCTIIGTCLHQDDLRKMAKRFDLDVRNMRVYDMHHTLVQWVGQDALVSKHINKFLNKKFAQTIKRYRSITCANDLLSTWRADFQQGDYVAAFWAAMRHPLAQLDFWHAAFGDMHMLSHQIAHEKSSDHRTLEKLKQDNASLEKKVARSQRCWHKSSHSYAQLTQDHQRAQQALSVLQQENAQLQARITQQASGNAQKMAQELQRLANNNLRLQQKNVAATALAQEKARQSNILSEQNQQLQHECQALEQQLTQTLGDENPCVLSQCLDRQAYKVLYVGGRPNSCPHMRSIVEGDNGKFQYHDGGLEENTANLDKLLCSADFVMCPVDCVSHDACLKVKKFCKRHAKPFIPLRSAGLSSFSVGLQTVKEWHRKSLN